MADLTDYDLIVIGGGPAGYAGAIRAGQLGKKVACIEMERAGGTCLNWGCIPTKALLKSAELYQKIKKAEAFGLSVKEVGFDFAKVMERSRGVAGQMAKGIEFLFRKNKITWLKGHGRFVGAAKGLAEGTAGWEIAVEADGKSSTVQSKNVIVATGHQDDATDHCVARRLFNECEARPHGQHLRTHASTDEHRLRQLNFHKGCYQPTSSFC
jgi:dihydrolipoamide dehydrogenase